MRMHCYYVMYINTGTNGNQFTTLVCNHMLTYFLTKSDLGVIYSMLIDLDSFEFLVVNV